MSNPSLPSALSQAARTLALPRHEQPEENAFTGDVFQSLMNLADVFDAWRCGSMAGELRTLAHNPDRTPFGYFWEERHVRTGEVVNSGFVLHPGTPPRGASGTRGFEYVASLVFRQAEA